MKHSKLYEFMKSGNDEKTLHVYHREMTDNLWRTTDLMLKKYNDYPRKIWQGKRMTLKKLKGDLRNSTA